jgi:hypothetical protein
MSEKRRDSLVGRAIEVVITDPWDLVTALGTSRLGADVAAVDARKGVEDAAALVRLKKPFLYEDSAREYFVASTRHEGESLLDLLNRGTVLCNLTSITAAQADSADPFDVEAWRGGLGLIATLQLAS